MGTHALARAEPNPDELGAILAISRAAAEGTEAGETLARIAETAAQLVGASGAAIVLRPSDSETGLGVAAAYGLSEQYTDFLNRIEPLQVGTGVSGTAVASRAPVPIDDVLTHPIIAPWRDVLADEGYRSVISIPLWSADSAVIGVLNVYRDRPGDWDERDIQLLTGLADHAAIAIRIARLLDESRRQVEGLSLMVRSLRSQAHEHSNRLHTIHGLLALGETEGAMRLIAEIEHGYHSSYGRITRRILNPALAGFLIAEQAIARQSGIELRIDRRSRLDELPTGLSDLDAVTIIGNLVHNAVDAVADCSRRSNRRISVAILQLQDEVVFRVRDWGRGASRDVREHMFERGFSDKEGHSGIGLALVRGIVRGAHGTIQVDPAQPGLVVAVKVPR
jgi:signal transduction histidine kinase